MKHISKKISKLLLFGSIFVTLSCEVQENYNENNKKQILVEDFSLRSIQGKTSSKLLETANKIKSLNATAANSKVVYNADFDFYIEDEHGIHMVVNGKDSYTFEITRTTGDQKVENIVFNEKQNGEFDTYFLKYDFTKEQYLNQDINWLSNRNRIVEVIVTNNNVLSKQRECGHWVVNPRFFKEAPGPDDHVNDTWISEPCSDAGDAGGNSGGGGFGGGSNGNFGGSGYYNGSNGNGNTGYNNNNNNPTGSNPQGGGNGVSTTPVLNLTLPCKELGEKDQDGVFNSLLTDLTNRASTQNFETAYAMYQNSSLGTTFSTQINGDSNNTETQGSVRLEVGGLLTQSNLNCIGFIHCHIDGVTFSVFSFADFIALAEVANVSTRPTEEFAIYVTTTSGTLALKIKNKIAFKQKLPIMKSVIQIFEDSFADKVRISDNLEKQKLGLLQFMKKEKFDSMLELYQKDIPSNDWKKQTLSANENEIIPINCN